MATFFQAVRFSTGLAMVAGGAVLMAPVAYEMADRAGVLTPAAVSAGDGVGEPQPAVAAHTIPDPLGSVDPSDRLMAPPPPPPPAEWLAPHPPAEPYRAPPPPPPLPAAFPGVVPGGEPAITGLDGTYRSTVRVPPPPLLDIAGPPPVAPGWTSREPSRPADVPALPARGAIPQSYVVQDGDSLTSLAIRFYGHPGAAAAILEANRDVFTRPDLLPIGISIRLPPPWTVSAVRPAGGPHTIEPGPGVDRGRPAEVGRSPFTPTSAPRPWLAPPAT